MKIGVTGHQSRDGISWGWVAQQMTEVLQDLKPECVFSSLAAGADQCFAKCALELDIPVHAVIPIHDYDEHFTHGARAEYLRLLKQCTRIDLNLDCEDPQESFFLAGKFILKNVDLIVALWDGLPAKGLGGTADVVSEGKFSGVPVLQIDPIRKTVNKI